MLGIHRRKIVSLATNLLALQAWPEDLKLLGELQKQIRAAIRQTERRILKLKESLNSSKRVLKSHRLTRSESSIVRDNIDQLYSKVKHHQWLLTVWRSFGDGIAFIYLDKWAIKPMMYNVANAEEKSRPGSILGKSGLSTELRMLRELLKAGIPALQTDLTNCIRHGDICVLAGPDPFPIEVKSSSNRNARVDRQLETLRSIVEYFNTDKIQNVRGMPEIRRKALPFRDVNYRSLLSNGISLAIRDGHFFVDPEPGMRLIVISRFEETTFDQCISGFNATYIYSINEAKNEGGWGVYYPFTLAIHSPDQLFAFLDGSIVISVAYDFETLAKAARRRGVRMTPTEDLDWPIQFEFKPKGSKTPGISRLGSHFLRRMIVELLSWDWLFKVERIWSKDLINESNLVQDA